MKIPFSNRVRFRAVLLFGAIAAIAATAFAVSSDFSFQGRLKFYDAFNGPAFIKTFELTVGPGETIPWHFHPGPAYVIVAEGNLTEQHPCKEPVVHPSGSALQELPNEVHQVSNHSSGPVKLHITQIYPTHLQGTYFVDPPDCNNSDENSDRSEDHTRRQ